MGAGPSLDEEATEAKKIIADFSAAFAKNYSKMYVIGVCQDVQSKLMKPQRKQQLMKCDRSAPPPIRKKGMILKESVHLKKWNPRFAVVKGDWVIDYYDSEELFEKGTKPRGSLNLSGYHIVKDLNNTLLHRIEKLAEKVNLPVSDLPKVPKFPDFTFECYHDRRPAMHFQCANAEDFKKWCDVFEDARYYAPSLSVTDDGVHQKVFVEALWRTRWEVDMWGWWSGGGGEVAYISDCISDRIEDVVMCKVDRKLTMPYMVRAKIRDTFLKTVNGTVTSAVTPMWAGAYSAVTKLRPGLEKQIEPLLKPLTDAQRDLQAKIMATVESTSNQVLREKITPHLEPLVNQIFSPITESFKLLITAFDHAVTSGKAGYKANDTCTYMVNHSSWSSEYWAAERKVYDLYDPLYSMRKVFDDVSPCSCTYRMYRRLRKTMDDALFTFETLHAGGKSWNEAHAEARAMMLHDAKLGILISLGRILEAVVGGLWQALVVKPCRALVRPLADAVPEAVQQFIDIDDMLKSTLKNILRNSCQSVFEPIAARISLT